MAAGRRSVVTSGVHAGAGAKIGGSNGVAAGLGASIRGRILDAGGGGTPCPVCKRATMRMTSEQAERAIAVQRAVRQRRRSRPTAATEPKDANGRSRIRLPTKE